MKSIVIICGSKTDLPQVKAVCESALWKMKITIHVMSCNRNSHELVDFIFNRLIDGEVVIGVGGKALALPGVIDAWVYHFKKNVRVAGVALGETGSNTGPEGLRELIERIDNSEPPPPKPRKDKPTQIDIC